jgi:hypothetical protein
LAERWNGTTWSVVTSPNRTGASINDLFDVTCTVATNCIGVGSATAGSTTTTLVERWNGTSWSIVASPNRGDDPEAQLNSVTCLSATSCFAVGGDSSYAMIQHWNGTNWTISGTPSGSSESQLVQVACPSTTLCFSVGNDVTATARVTLVEERNGTTSTLVPSPNPTGASSSRLTGVSCPTTTSCVAVGYSGPSSAPTTLVESWNGTSWSIVTSPNRTGTGGSELLGVSCTAATSCVAVGVSGKSSASKTLVESWNGTSWSIVTSPNGTDTAASSLQAVSCSAATSCVAVGGSMSPVENDTLTEVWNGTSWSIVASPNAAGANLSELTGVSCSSATTCVAVGRFSTSAGNQTLAEIWNGASWSITATANPTGAFDSQLNGVSCPAASTTCFAVGSYDTDSAGKTLVELWNGTSWSVMSSPNPSLQSSLSGVSCPATTACDAVGDSFTSTSDDALIERYA